MTLTTADLAAGGVGGSGKPPASQARPGHAVRRTHSAAYKLRILQEHDALTEPGARGALLRREGLYQSSINKWRRARDEGALAGGRPGALGNDAVGSGQAPVAGSGLSKNERVLVAENARLTAELAQTKAVLAVVGKATALLEVLSERAG